MGMSALLLGTGGRRGGPCLESLDEAKRESVYVPEARLGVTQKEGELDTAPAGAGKRRSFSLTLVSLVASPFPRALTDKRPGRSTDRPLDRRRPRMWARKLL